MAVYNRRRKLAGFAGFEELVLKTLLREGRTTKILVNTAHSTWNVKCVAQCFVQTFHSRQFFLAASPACCLDVFITFVQECHWSDFAGLFA